MVENTVIAIEIGGQTFPVAVHDDTYELHGRRVSDSKQGVVYQGRFRRRGI
jgi:hypothetical protein